MGETSEKARRGGMGEKTREQNGGGWSTQAGEDRMNNAVLVHPENLRNAVMIVHGDKTTLFLKVARTLPHYSLTQRTGSPWDILTFAQFFPI